MRRRYDVITSFSLSRSPLSVGTPLRAKLLLIGRADTSRRGEKRAAHDYGVKYGPARNVARGGRSGKELLKKIVFALPRLIFFCFLPGRGTTYEWLGYSSRVLHGNCLGRKARDVLDSFLRVRIIYSNRHKWTTFYVSNNDTTKSAIHMQGRIKGGAKGGRVSKPTDTKGLYR